MRESSFPTLTFSSEVAAGGSKKSNVMASPAALAVPQPTIAVKIQDLDAWYGDFHVLHEISIDIPERNVTAFIGPSGCGKSTLLRWMNRMNDMVVDAKATGTCPPGHSAPRVCYRRLGG